MEGSSIHYLPNQLSQYIATHDDGGNGEKNRNGHENTSMKSRTSATKSKPQSKTKDEPQIKLDIRSKLKRGLNRQKLTKVFDAYALLGVAQDAP